MGRPMARHLIKAGHKLLILSKSSSAAELTAEGAITFNNPKALASEADTVITMLPDSPEVEEIVFGTEGIFGGFEKRLAFY